MDMERYLAEVSRVLKSNGFEVAPFSEGHLPVLLNGEVACCVGGSGTLFLRPGDLHTEEANELYHKVAPFSEMVLEYMHEMERAPVLKAVSLDERFKLLADFGGVVLAGHETEKGAGMQFVTWLWDFDRKGVTLGHYFGDGYQEAKQDFAIRSGLVREQKQFTPEQLTEIYRCIQDTLDHQYDISYEQEALLRETQEQIVDAVPDFPQRVAEAQAQEEATFSHTML